VNKINRMKSMALVSLLAMSLLATACNTVEGAGKDTQNLGKDISHSAEENK
jgi:predicted small secreted protein